MPNKGSVIGERFCLGQRVIPAGEKELASVAERER